LEGLVQLHKLHLRLRLMHRQHLMLSKPPAVHPLLLNLELPGQRLPLTNRSLTSSTVVSLASASPCRMLCL
jgi:hypothetical protein